MNFLLLPMRSCLMFCSCSAVLAHFVLKENLHMFGVVGCILCVVGSIGIVLHAPKERKIDSMKEIWHLATQPGSLLITYSCHYGVPFLSSCLHLFCFTGHYILTRVHHFWLTGFIVYSCVAVACVLFLIFRVVERSGHRLMLVYIAICSLMGSLTVHEKCITFRLLNKIDPWSFINRTLWLEQVISVKAVAIALKLSFSGSNQFIYIQTWFFIVVVTICCLVQLNYLNKVYKCSGVWIHSWEIGYLEFLHSFPF